MKKYKMQTCWRNWEHKRHHNLQFSCFPFVGHVVGHTFYIYLSILIPLIAFFTTPLLSSNPNLRDSLGPIGGIITFYSSLNIASLYLNGEILSYTFFEINETLSISFKITGCL